MSASPVLVTGATGFLGLRVVRRLVEQRRSVRVLVRPGTSEGVFESVRGAAPEVSIEVVAAAFTDVAALTSALRGTSSVLHLAAAKAGSAAAQVANTVVGSDHLFRAAVAAGVPRFVLVSSLGVMGAAAVRRGGLIDEDTPLEPHPERRDPYTFAKLRQEQLAWKFHRESGLPLVVLRPGVIFGPGQNLLSARVGVSFAGIFLHLGGGMTVPLTYVDNCADAICTAADASGIVGRAFCVVDDDLPSSRTLLRLYGRRVQAVPFVPLPFVLLRTLARLNLWYSERTHGHLPAVFTPYKVDSMWKGHRFSNSRLKRELGWQPRLSMAEALDRSFQAPQPKA